MAKDAILTETENEILAGVGVAKSLAEAPPLFSPFGDLFEIKDNRIRTRV